MPEERRQAIGGNLAFAPSMMKKYTHFFLLVFTSITTLPELNAKVDDIARIAIVAAYQGELDAQFDIIETETIEKEVIINGITFYLGTAYGKPVIFFKTNVSTINAAMTTQLALSNFNINTLLFSGIAGGINPNLKKGDVAIPEKWYYHAEGGYFNPKTDSDESHTTMRREFEYRYPYKPFGMHYPSYVRATRAGMTEVIPKKYFAADSDLLALAAKVIKTLQADENTQLINSTGNAAQIAINGSGVAGPVFMDNADYRKYVYDTWKADSLDMESTAIAHVCWSNNVPFIVIRSLSDLAGGQEGANQIEAFAKKAERNAAQILDAILEAL